MVNSKPLRVLIAGGGTGGHLFPGLAVARELRSRQADASVTFVGTATGLEARAVPREGFPVEFIRSAGLKGMSSAARLRGLGLVLPGVWDAWRLVSRHRPHLVVGVGGYSSGPVVLVAAMRRIPTLVLEQNARPGLTNRLLAPFVRAAAVTYEAALPYFRGKGFVSGNPVRPEFFIGPGERDQEVPDDVTRILILGGSQGAHAINVAMVEAATELAARRARVSITHQTGERDLELVREGYRRAGMAAAVEPFIVPMAREMSRADIVVCRAGATTLAELCAVGRPAILIPLPTATDDHQRKNAEVLAEAGAAELLEQRTLTGSVLAARLLALAGDPGKRDRMASVARGLARPEAARVIVDRLLELAER